MLEIIVDIETNNERLIPIQVMICYRDDGSIYSVDWREQIISLLDDIDEEYNSEDDKDYLPSRDDDDEILEYTSNDDSE